MIIRARAEVGPRQRFDSFHLSELSLTEDVDGGRTAADILRELGRACEERHETSIDRAAGQPPSSPA